jgi:Family of unknown function (DUF6529)
MGDDAAHRRTDRAGLSVPLTALLAGSAVALLIGVIGKVREPSLAGTTTLGYDTVIEMKVSVSIVIGLLVVLQLLGALWLYGRLGIAAPSWLGKAHRISGTVALFLSLFVAYHCLVALGLESGTLPDGHVVPLRTVVHGVVGCAIFGAVVAKIMAVRSRRAPRWFLPVAGGLLVTLFVVVLSTSVVWYVGERGWPN